jgi:hypothetical protein
MITRNNKYGKIEEVRPTFSYRGPDPNTGCYDRESVLMQLAEDIRNNLEELNRKQMLQCDVRGEIREMNANVRRMARAVGRLAAKLALYKDRK